MGDVDQDMTGRARLFILVLFSIVFAALLVVWVLGLIDLGNGDEGEVLLEHEWRAVGTHAEPEFHEVSLPFEVGSRDVRLRISYEVDLPSDLTVGLPGSVGNPSPEVRLELLDGVGTVVWAEEFYRSAGSTEDINVTMTGDWTLHVWAKGYGYEGETGLGTPVEFHDTLDVTILAV
jgi:hypothetical protein